MQISIPKCILCPLFLLNFAIFCDDLKKDACNELDVKLAFSSFKISNMSSVKDPVPVEL